MILCHAFYVVNLIFVGQLILNYGRIVTFTSLFCFAEDYIMRSLIGQVGYIFFYEVPMATKVVVTNKASYELQHKQL